MTSTGSGCTTDELKTVYPGAYAGTFSGAVDWAGPDGSGHSIITGSFTAQVTDLPDETQEVTWESGTIRATATGSWDPPGHSFPLDGATEGVMEPWGMSNLANGKLTPVAGHDLPFHGNGSYTVHVPEQDQVLNWPLVTDLRLNGIATDCVGMSGTFATLDVSGGPKWIIPSITQSTTVSWTTPPTWELKKVGGDDQLVRDIAAARKAVADIMAGAVDHPTSLAAADALGILWTAHQNDPDCLRRVYLQGITGALDTLKQYWVGEIEKLHDGPYKGPAGDEAEKLTVRAQEPMWGWTRIDKLFELAFPPECRGSKRPFGDALMQLSYGFLIYHDIMYAFRFNRYAIDFDPSEDSRPAIQDEAYRQAKAAFRALTDAYAADPGSVTLAMIRKAIATDTLSTFLTNETTGVRDWLTAHGMMGSGSGSPGPAPRADVPIYHDLTAGVTVDGTLSWGTEPGVLRYFVLATDPSMRWMWSGSSSTVPFGAAEGPDLPAFDPTPAVTYGWVVIAVGMNGEPLASSRLVDYTPLGAPARLRVTTSPAVPAEISVDGVARDRWGLNWVALPTGAHQVCFGAVPGFSAPPCQDVATTVGETATVQGTYTPEGYLRVITEPAVPSTITIDGVARNDWGLWPEVAPGTHTVCFGNVAGFNVPPCRDVLVTAGATATTTGTFSANPNAVGPDGTFGYLRATTDPPVGAMITVDGKPRNNWGLDWLKVPVGSHEVCFGPALDATAPTSCTTTTVTDRTTSAVVGTYAPTGFLRVLTDPPLPATIRVNGQIANAWGVWTTEAPGTYTVCFGPQAGRTTPACQDATVTPGATTTITGSYGTG